jgi:hypothetical protein
MTRLRRLVTLCGVTAAGIVMPAWADVPGVLDRVPEGAWVVATVRNLGQAQSKIEGLAKQFGADLSDDEEGPGAALKFLKLGGLNQSGSAAFVVLGEDKEGGQPKTVGVLPVSDFKAFLTALGGKEGAGALQVSIDGNDAFVKDVGGGYAVISDKKENVEAFEGKAGHKSAFEKMLGKTGSSLADSDDVLFIANIPALAPKMREGVDKMKQQAAGMAGMAGGQAPNTALVEAAADAVIRDGQVGLMGLRSGEAGIALDFGAQFKEGSETAALMNAKGKAHDLLKKVPNRAFLAAFAMDTSSPAIKKWFDNIQKLNLQASPDMAKAMGGADMMGMMQKADGMAMLWGTSMGGLMGGGLLLNSVTYMATKDPASVIKTMQTAYGAKDADRKVAGMTITSSYQPAAVQVDGSPVDAWSMKMAMDPGNPAAQQLQMMQMMLFGPTGGMSGYVAPAAGGVVTTFSKNSALMGEALTAAKEGKGLAADPGIDQIASHLPEDRVLEGYIGIKGIMDMVMPMMAMMTGPVNFEVPADLAPVGVGATAQDGGMRGTFFVPQAVLTMAKNLREAVKAAKEKEAPEAPMKEDTGQPRF